MRGDEGVLFGYGVIGGEDKNGDVREEERKKGKKKWKGGGACGGEDGEDGMDGRNGRDGMESGLDVIIYIYFILWGS